MLVVMAPPALAEAHVAGVPATGLADGASQAVGALGHGHEVNVVRHQAVGPHLDATDGASLRHQGEVHLIVLAAQEGLLTAVAALGDVVGHPRHHHASESGHAPTLTPQPGRVKRMVKCGVPTRAAIPSRRLESCGRVPAEGAPQACSRPGGGPRRERKGGRSGRAHARWRGPQR